MTSQPFDWIDPQDHDQIAWAMNYVARKRAADRQLNMAFPGHDFYAPQQLIEALNTLPNDAMFRELDRQMRGAWRTHQYRKSHGKQVSFQLTHDTLKQLDGLAKKYKQSKVQTLSQVISDAWHDHQRATVEAKRAKETYQKRLKEQQTKYLKTEPGYTRVIENLLEALTEEIHQRCCLEAQLGGPNNSPLEGDTLDDYHARVEKRVTALKPTRNDLRLMHTKPLRQRMQTLADAHGLLPQGDDSQPTPHDGA